MDIIPGPGHVIHFFPGSRRAVGRVGWRDLAAAARGGRPRRGGEKQDGRRVRHDSNHIGRSCRPERGPPPIGDRAGGHRLARTRHERLPRSPRRNRTRPRREAREGGRRRPKGAERSRRNALKHGLRARFLLPDDLAAAVAERTADFADEFARDALRGVLVGEMGLATARLERCAAMSLADLGTRRPPRRALLGGGPAAGRRGPRRPAPEGPGAGARALRRTRQGADWLIERWEALGEVLRTNGGWDDAQRRLAFDLLGVPPELRRQPRKVLARRRRAGLAALAARPGRARCATTRRRRSTSSTSRSALMTAAGMPLEEDAADRPAPEVRGELPGGRCYRPEGEPRRLPGRPHHESGPRAAAEARVARPAPTAPRRPAAPARPAMRASLLPRPASGFVAVAVPPGGRAAEPSPAAGAGKVRPAGRRPPPRPDDRGPPATAS